MWNILDKAYPPSSHLPVRTRRDSWVGLIELLTNRFLSLVNRVESSLLHIVPVRNFNLRLESWRCARFPYSDFHCWSLSMGHGSEVNIMFSPCLEVVSPRGSVQMRICNIAPSCFKFGKRGGLAFSGKWKYAAESSVYPPPNYSCSKDTVPDQQMITGSWLWLLEHLSLIHNEAHILCRFRIETWRSTESALYFTIGTPLLFPTKPTPKFIRSVQSPIFWSTTTAIISYN